MRRDTLHRCCAYTFCFCLLVGLAGPASGQQVLDQSNIATTFSFDAAIVGSQQLAQTFPVTIGGLLSRVDLQVYRSPGTVNDITLRVIPAPGGVPDPDEGDALLTHVIPISSVPEFASPPAGTLTPISIDLTAHGLNVSPGQGLAISLVRPGAGSPPWALWRTNANVYTNGVGFVRNNSTAPWAPLQSGTTDMGFQTFITIPEPASATATLGLAVLAIGRRRGRR